MRRTLVAILVALSVGVAPVAADDSGVPSAPDAAWAQPAATVDTAPAVIVESSGESGGMSVVYAVQDGEALRVDTVSATDAADARRTIADIQATSDVIAVDVDVPRRVTGLGQHTVAAAAASDPARAEQWGLTRLRAESAWAASTGSGVTVAILDTGVARHPDLTGPFVAGIDLVNGGSERSDGNGHGTHVAGIIGMTANNGQGGAGLAPGAALMPVVVADASGWVTAADSANGILWAVDQGADILNLSYSGPASSVEQKAVEYALSKGVVVVAAVGNAYVDAGGSVYNPIQYPAAYPGVVGVGAVTRSLRRAAFSEVGKQVDVAAPGGSGLFDSSLGIYSTYLDGRYVRMPGTSMAAPFASAALAMVIARERALAVDVSASDVVLSTARDLGATGRDDEFGFGLIDPVAALDLVTSSATTGTPAPVVNPAEVQTRIEFRMAAEARPGLLRYHIPERGRFVVSVQRARQGRWSKPAALKGTRAGHRWHRLTVPAGLKVRITAERADERGESAPVWISPALRTRKAG